MIVVQTTTAYDNCVGARMRATALAGASASEE